jgi:hypothetical protein
MQAPVFRDTIFAEPAESDRAWSLAKGRYEIARWMSQPLLARALAAPYLFEGDELLLVAEAGAARDELVSHAERTVGKGAVRTTSIKRGVRAWQPPRGSFDAVMLVHLTHSVHETEVAPLLGTVRSMLRSGGRVSAVHAAPRSTAPSGMYLAAMGFRRLEVHRLARFGFPFEMTTFELVTAVAP